MAGHPAQQSLGGDIGAVKPARIEEAVHSNVVVFNSAPNNAIGSNGQWAIRVDVTSAGSRVYQKIGGIWTATTL